MKLSIIERISLLIAMSLVVIPLQVAFIMWVDAASGAITIIPFIAFFVTDALIFVNIHEEDNP